MTCTAITTLLDAAAVGHIYMPQMEGELTGSFKRSFGKLYAQIKQNNIPITRLYNTARPLDIGPITITVTPHGTKKYQTISYPHLALTTAIGTTPIAIKGR